MTKKKKKKIHMKWKSKYISSVLEEVKTSQAVNHVGV